MILNVIEYYTVKKNLILTQELWNKVKQRVRNLKVAATDGFWMTVFRDEPPDVEVKGRPLTYGVIASTSVPGYRPEFGNEDVINH